MPSLDGHLEPTTVLAGKLRIIRLIGEGGMGAVYEVEHQFTKHRRALTLLRPELTLTPDVVNRFLREASAAGRIGNPHILETFDAGTLETGEPYIVMELLEGRSLADVIAQRGRLGFGEALQIVGQACEAIFELVVARALHVNRDSRYPTPAAFAQALSALSGRGGTLLSNLAVRAATDAAHSANTGHTLVLPSGTNTGLVSDASRERRRLPKPVWLAPAVLVVVLAAVVFGNRASPGESAARVGVQPTVPAPASPRTDVDWPTPAPRVSPVIRTPELPPKGSTSAAAGVKSSAGSEPALKSRPAGSEKSGAPSRARQHGLAEENPFAVAPGTRAPEPRR